MARLSDIIPSDTGTGGGGGTAPVYNLLYDNEIFYDTGDETYFPFLNQTGLGGAAATFGSSTEFVNSGTKAVGQRFTFKNTKTITSVDFPIVQLNLGNPKGTIVMEIRKEIASSGSTTNILASTSFDAETTLSGLGDTTILNVPISGGVTLSPDRYIVSFRFETYISGTFNFRSSVMGTSNQNPPYIQDQGVAFQSNTEGSYVSSTNSGLNFSSNTTKNLCFRINVDKDPVTGFAPQIQFFEDIILQTPGLPNTANVIPVSESPILMPNNGDIAYVTPNTSTGGDPLTVTVVNGPENVPTNARIIATKIQESETLTDNAGTSSVTTDKKNIIMIENQAIRAALPRLYYWPGDTFIQRTGYTKGISMPIKIRLFDTY